MTQLKAKTIHHWQDLQGPAAELPSSQGVLIIFLSTSVVGPDPDSNPVDPDPNPVDPDPNPVDQDQGSKKFKKKVPTF